jgi:hypothetical protein
MSTTSTSAAQLADAIEALIPGDPFPGHVVGTLPLTITIGAHSFTMHARATHDGGFDVMTPENGYTLYTRKGARPFSLRATFYPFRDPNGTTYAHHECAAAPWQVSFSSAHYAYEWTPRNGFDKPDGAKLRAAFDAIGEALAGMSDDQRAAFDANRRDAIALRDAGAVHSAIRPLREIVENLRERAA